LQRIAGKRKGFSCARPLSDELALRGFCCLEDHVQRDIQRASDGISYLAMSTIRFIQSVENDLPIRDFDQLYV
jgi:hypothetical protein